MPEHVRSFQEYAVKTFVDNDTGVGRLEVYKKGQLIYQSRNHHFYIGLLRQEDKKTNERVAMGRDITGKGIPNLVVSEWTGEAHCCYSFCVFEIGREFKKVAEINAEHSEGAYFQDVNGDHKLEFVGNDWTFAYWHAAFAQSPAPQIILRFQDDQYVLATDLMQKPAPSAIDIQSHIQTILRNASWSWETPEPPADLWGYMLELIYAGHAEQAQEVFLKAWPENVPGKEKFLGEFWKRLSRSPYWPQIRNMNSL
jgi:hypothetical protein